MHSSTVSDHSSRSSDAKLFGIEFSDLYVSKEDSVQPRCDQHDSKSSKRKTSLMKTLFLCQVMSPLLLTRRGRRPLGYVNPGKTLENHVGDQGASHRLQFAAVGFFTRDEEIRHA
jgi:hypothetical protein